MKTLFYMSLLMLLAAFSAAGAYAQNDLALCQLRSEHMAAHKPADDVTYRPGADMVNGKPVVPADIGGSVDAAAFMPDVVRIPLTINLAERLGQPVPAGVEMTTELGMIEIKKSGEVTFNGKDLTGQASILCGEQPATEKPADLAPAAAAAPAPVQDKKAPDDGVITKDEIIWGQGY